MSLGAEVSVGFIVEGGAVVASILVTLLHPPYLEEACSCSWRERLASSSQSRMIDGSEAVRLLDR